MLSRIRETLYFIGSLIRNPVRIGAVAPSSRSLARMMSDSVELNADGVVVEIGAGTGVVTQALLDAGVPRDQLYVVELDERMHAYLTERFPGVTVLHGDAAKVHELIPSNLLGKVTTVVSSLPVRAMPFGVQQAILKSSFDVLRPGGIFIQYTYPPRCPLPANELGLAGEKLGRIWLNLPPAAVWRFRQRRVRAMA